MTTTTKSKSIFDFVCITIRDRKEGKSLTDKRSEGYGKAGVVSIANTRKGIMKNQNKDCF